MDIAEFLKLERIAVGVRASNKRRVFESLAELLAKDNHGLNATQIFESLLTREYLGSTALEKGIALPHGRMKGIQRVCGAFLQLKSGIPFDAHDNERVDLFFALLVPDQTDESANEHLCIISRLARMFSEPELRRHLRKTKMPEASYDLIITNWRSLE
jgi:PTS system nitrogen regulatory IIA component